MTEENVRWLDISVDNSSAVAEVNCFDKFLDDRFDLLWRDKSRVYCFKIFVQICVKEFKDKKYV